MYKELLRKLLYIYTARELFQKVLGNTLIGIYFVLLYDHNIVICGLILLVSTNHVRWWYSYVNAKKNVPDGAYRRRLEGRWRRIEHFLSTTSHEHPCTLSNSSFWIANFTHSYG